MQSAQKTLVAKGFPQPHMHVDLVPLTEVDLDHDQSVAVGTLLDHLEDL
jgi:transcriptional/translational regulatory protein YebC/TACO1